MTLLEIGIFKNQNLIFHKEFYPLRFARTYMTPNRRMNLINLIRRMSEIVIANRQLNALENGRYRIYFTNNTLNPLNSSSESIVANLFMYAICDRYSSTEIIKPILIRLLTEFIRGNKEYLAENIDELSHYEGFESIIQALLSDEVLTPGDRVRNFLF